MKTLPLCSPDSDRKNPARKYWSGVQPPKGALKKKPLLFLLLAFCFLLFSICLFPSEVQSQQAGQSGFASLKIGVGGRAAGLAETQVAAVNDPTAIYWNAAGLERSQGTVALFSHASWLQGISADFLAVTFPALRGAMGLALHVQNVPDIQHRTTASPEPIGLFDAHDLVLALAYGRALRDRLRVGLTLKYVYERIYIESVSGVAVDAGILLKDLPGGLRLGAVLQNLGRTSRFRREAITLPVLVRVGFAYSMRACPCTIMSDIFVFRGGDSGATVAGEYVFQEVLAVRTGYQFSRENRGIAGGLGLQWGRLHLDYGYMPFASGLGDTHRLSALLRW